MYDDDEDLSVVLPVGTTLIIKTGIYSDLSWHGPVRVVRAFSKAEVAAAYRAAWKPDQKRKWEEKPSPDGFLPWLLREGYVESIPDVKDWHVGSYDEFTP